MSRRSVNLVVGAARQNRHVSHRELLDFSLVVRATTGRPPL
jgi:hypothetical protein